MSKIILTADDYGAIDAIDDGIIDAIENSPLRSVASFANSPEAPRRLERLKRLKQEFPALEIGCHLTLTSGSPILSVDEAPSLYDHDTGNPINFRSYKDFTFSMIESEVEAELRAQMKVFADLGIKIDHLTCHHNSLDYFEKFHRIFMNVAYGYYPGEIIPTRSPNVDPSWKGNIYRSSVRFEIAEENNDAILRLFTLFTKKINSENKVKHLLEEYDKTDARIPVCVNSSHYGFPDKKVKSREKIERKAPKRRENLLRAINRLARSNKTYEFVFHLIADDHDRYPQFVDQLRTQDYANGIDDNYFDGRMIELKSLKGITTEDLNARGAEISSWSQL